MTNIQTNIIPTPLPKDILDKTFQEIINIINVDHLLMETNTADEMTKRFYEDYSIGNFDAIQSQTKTIANLHFMKRIIADFLEGVKQYNVNKIGLTFSDDTLYSWVQIKDNDFEAEDSLWLLEAKINANYHQYGMHLSTMVVEESDCIPMPANYKSIKE